MKVNLKLTVADKGCGQTFKTAFELTGQNWVHHTREIVSHCPENELLSHAAEIEPALVDDLRRII